MKVWGAFLGAAVIAGCAAPPDRLAAGEADGGIAWPPDAGADGAVEIGAPDAAPAPPDACVPYVPPDGDAGADNPYGIALTDVTYAMPEQYLGGRKDRDTVSFGSGALIADLDGDGDLDVVLARIDVAGDYPGGPAMLLENQGGFDHLVPRPDFAAGFVGQLAHAASAADYDADGDLDLFVGLEGRDRLLRNDGGLSFTDVALVAGVEGPADTNTSGGVWADVNADGLLDLYVITQTPMLGGFDAARNANRLYLNRGDGTFRDVTASAGVGGNGSSHAALIGELDGDPELEIYVANDRFAVNGIGGFDQLDGDRVYDLGAIDDDGVPIFDERSNILGINDPRSSMGIALADIDHNGVDDLYITDFGRNHVELWNPLGPSYGSDFGYYGLDSAATPDGDPLVSWGARFVDLDRDGWLELFVVNGDVTLPVTCRALLQRDIYFRSEGGTYREVTAAVGLPPVLDCQPDPAAAVSGRGLAAGDLDGDGDDDFIVTPFIEAFRFVRNDSCRCERPAARIRLRGTVSGVDPAGTVVVAELIDGRVIRRQLYAGGDTYSQSDRLIELPLVTPVAAAEVRWPSGRVESIVLRSFEEAGVVELVEPAWLTVSARSALAVDPPPILTFELPAGSSPVVAVVRSDGEPVAVTDQGDGRYTASIVHPGTTGRVVLAVVVDGEPLPPRPAIEFR